MLLSSLHLTVQTLSRELLMTHAADVVLINDVMVLRRRNLNLHSCAGGSRLAPGRCSTGYVDCHYGNGGVRDDEGDESDGWDVLGLCPKSFATPVEDFNMGKCA